MITVVRKTAFAETFYTGTWAGFLLEGETITSSVWDIETGDDGLTVYDAASVHPPSVNGMLVTVWVSGGTGVFAMYKVRNRIVTSLGRKLESGFMVEIVEAAA